MHLRFCLLLALVGAVLAQNATEVASAKEQECTATQVSEYSMAWHVGAIFIVLCCSGIGIFSTLTMGALAEKRPFAVTLQLFKMFGIGVIAATGWCHLLPDAFASFTSECLPDGWAAYGAAFVGVFALGASFVVQTIELAAGGGHSHGTGMTTSPVALPVAVEPEVGPVQDRSSFKDEQSLQLESQSHIRTRGVATVILEAGILFHSLIIGVSLGVTGDFDTFRTLLMAICFHQFFEGLALGALISKLSHSTVYKFLVLGLLYPLTTPIGMVIGISIRRSYNENSSGAIVTEGIFNSLSAGILLYNTYSELLATEVNHNRKFKNYSLPFKVLNMLVLYLGAASMAVLAYWA